MLLQTIFLECLYHWLIQYYKQLQNDATIFFHTSVQCQVTHHHFLVLSPIMVGQRSLVGYSPWGCKELDTTEHTHTHTHIVGLSKSFPPFLHSFLSLLLPFPFLCFPPSPSCCLPPSLSLFLSFLTFSPFHGLPWSVGFPRGSTGKESACNAEDPGSIPGLVRSPGEGISYPPQYSWASMVTQTVKNLPAMRETWV